MSKIKIKVRELPFYIGFFVMILYKFIIVILGEDWGLKRSVILIPVLILFLERYLLIKKYLIKDCCLMFLGVVIFLTSKDDTFLMMMMILIVSRGIDERRIITFWYKIQKVIMVAIIILYIALLLLKSPLAEIQYEEGRTRYYFMFSHPNIFSIQLLFTVLAFIYLNYDKISEIKVYVILVALGIFVFVFPNSKSSAITAFIIALLFFIGNHSKIVYKYAVKVMVPILAIFILYFINKAIGIYTVGQGAATISIFSNRFDLAAIALKMYPPKLFGQYVDTIGTNVFWNGKWRMLWIDMAYVRLFITCGVVGAIIYLYVLIRENYYEIKNKAYLHEIMLVAVMLMGSSEWMSFSILTSFPLIFIRRSLWNTKISK